jgi:hypothetical protein
VQTSWVPCALEREGVVHSRNISARGTEGLSPSPELPLQGIF